MRKMIRYILLAVILILTSSSESHAARKSLNYQIIIEDQAKLLTPEQEVSLRDVMGNIATYGNVAFVSIPENNTSTEVFAQSFYKEHFKNASGTLFLIDMDNRMIWIHSDGAIYKVITTSYANTITDNVYRYASNEEYYECAAEAFNQIFTLLEGDRIAQPMKYISNAFLALILAFMLNFALVSYLARLKQPSDAKLLKNTENHFTFTKPVVHFTHKTKVYDPVESGGGSSGGSRSSSGGGGSRSSGGSSGGGGGHRF